MGIFNKIFKSYSEKEVKRVMPLVEKINGLEEEISKLTDEQFQQVDSSYFLKTRKETYGWDVLTNQRQFYLENYPDIIVEKNNFDTLFSMMLRGE